MLKLVQNLLLGKSETELKFDQAIDELKLLSQAFLVNDSSNKLIRRIDEE